jgi:hypothetical protein
MQIQIIIIDPGRSAAATPCSSMGPVGMAVSASSGAWQRTTVGDLVVGNRWTTKNS